MISRQSVQMSSTLQTKLGLWEMWELALMLLRWASGLQIFPACTPYSQEEIEHCHGWISSVMVRHSLSRGDRLKNARQMKEGKRYEMNFIPLQARSLYWGFFLMLHQHVLSATFDQFSGAVCLVKTEPVLLFTAAQFRKQQPQRLQLYAEPEPGV